MVRRTLVILSAVLAATLIVAGCGGSEDKGGAPGEQEDTGSGSGSASEAGGGETTGGAEGGQLTAITPGEAVFGTRYVSPLVEIFGDVYIGERSFVAGNTVLRAAPERRLEIGNETNAQNNLIFRALNQFASPATRLVWRTTPS